MQTHIAPRKENPMTYTTVDGQPLPWPTGVTLVHVGPFSSLLLGTLFVPPPPPDVTAAR
jgi:hypothetical protein